MFKLLLAFAIFFFLGYGILSFFTKFFRTNNKQQQNNNNNNNSTQAEQDEKQFPKDVGEYVNYEEVKEENKKTL